MRYKIIKNKIIKFNDNTKLIIKIYNLLFYEIKINVINIKNIIIIIKIIQNENINTLNFDII